MDSLEPRNPFRTHSKDIQFSILIILKKSYIDVQNANFRTVHVDIWSPHIPYKKYKMCEATP
jgi:hypothetical protein